MCLHAAFSVLSNRASRPMGLLFPPDFARHDDMALERCVIMSKSEEGKKLVKWLEGPVFLAKTDYDNRQNIHVLSEHMQKTFNTVFHCRLPVLLKFGAYTCYSVGDQLTMWVKDFRMGRVQNVTPGLAPGD